MADWEWPHWLDEYQRQYAVYEAMQRQVRFSATVAEIAGKRGWFANTARVFRQNAYRNFVK